MRAPVHRRAPPVARSAVIHTPGQITHTRDENKACHLLGVLRVHPQEQAWVSMGQPALRSFPRNFIGQHTIE